MRKRSFVSNLRAAVLAAQTVCAAMKMNDENSLSKHRRLLHERPTVGGLTCCWLKLDTCVEGTGCCVHIWYSDTFLRRGALHHEYLVSTEPPHSGEFNMCRWTAGCFCNWRKSLCRGFVFDFTENLEWTMFYCDNNTAWKPQCMFGLLWIGVSRVTVHSL